MGFFSAPRAVCHELRIIGSSTESTIMKGVPFMRGGAAVFPFSSGTRSNLSLIVLSERSTNTVFSHYHRTFRFTRDVLDACDPTTQNARLDSDACMFRGGASSQASAWERLRLGVFGAPSRPSRATSSAEGSVGRFPSLGWSRCGRMPSPSHRLGTGRGFSGIGFDSSARG